MDVPLYAVIGLALVIYGLVILWQRKATLNLRRFDDAWRDNPPNYVHLHGITAVCFGLCVTAFGSIIGSPAWYQIAVGKPLPDEFRQWIFIFGFGSIGICIIAVATNGILRIAKAFGDDIYARNQKQDQQKEES